MRPAGRDRCQHIDSFREVDILLCQQGMLMHLKMRLRIKHTQWSLQFCRHGKHCMVDAQHFGGNGIISAAAGSDGSIPVAAPGAQGSWLMVPGAQRAFLSKV